MKITAFVGSPKRDGNTATLVDALLKGARKNGHETQIRYLYDLKFTSCIDCGYCKTQGEDCPIPDDFQLLKKDVETSDGLVIASPIYFGQITGPTKCFLDRWCTFFSPGFAVRRLGTKKFATITVSAAPEDRFKSAGEYLRYWLAEFFKLQYVGGLSAGNLVQHDQAAKSEEWLQKAADLGASF